MARREAGKPQKSRQRQRVSLRGEVTLQWDGFRFGDDPQGNPLLRLPRWWHEAWGPLVPLLPKWAIAFAATYNPEDRLRRLSVLQMRTFQRSKFQLLA
jgi:hypothetical protein